MIHDLRFALRRLRQSPGFTALAVATLAVGIAANALIFGVVDGVLVEPLPYPDADRLVMLTDSGDVSLPDGEDWRAESRTLEDIGLFLRSWSFDLLRVDAPPRRLQGVVAEPEVFRALGVEPVLGRLLVDADDRADAEPAIVVSQELWRELGGGDDVLGRELRLSGKTFRVVGVAPPQLDVFEDGVSLWVTPSVETPWAVGNRGTNNFDALARLAPGIDLDAARAEMLAISERLAEAYPRTNRGKVARPRQLRQVLLGAASGPLLVLLAAVGVLLAVSGVNLASLLLARSSARAQELATRAALGAGRTRLLRQVLTETALLGLLGGVGGTFLALWGQDALLAWAPADLPRRAGIGLDGRVVGLALGLSVVVGLAIGLLPAWRALRLDLGRLRPGSDRATGGRRQRLLGALVIAETALAAVLLVAAALLVRSYQELDRVELGFEPEGVWTASLVLPETRYGGDREAQTRAFEAVVEGLGRLPGVTASASAIGAPLEPRGGIGHRLVFDDAELMAGIEPGEEPGARHRPVLGEHFRALAQPVIEGRAFDARDHADATPVAIVNRRFARAVWGDASPLGERVAWRPGEGEAPRWMEIVGVVADVKSTTLEKGDAPAVYTPYVQRLADWQRWGTLLVRLEGDPASFTERARAVVASVDPELPLADVRTLEQKRRGGLAQRRFATSLLLGFAVLAVGLAVLGLYGVLAYAVEQRRRELGVRLALGARGRDLVAAVLGRGLVYAGAGLAVGLPVARALSGLLESQLYGVAPTDPATYAAAAAALVACAAAGCWLPARRAAEVDPNEVLRDE